MEQLLNFIGRGSCFNEEQNNNSAFFILPTYNIFTLIDCGSDIFKQILRLKLIDDNIKTVNIIITHLHSDHVGSLGSLIEYCNYVKNIKPTVFFADKSLIAAYLGMCKVDPSLYELEDYYYDIMENEITFVPVEHGVHKNCYALAMDLWDGCVYYSGDSSDINFNYINDFESFTKSISKFDQFYQDLTLQSYPDNPHMNIDKFVYRLDYLFNGNEDKVKEFMSKIYAIHSDGEEIDIEVLKRGMNIPDVIYNKEHVIHTILNEAGTTSNNLITIPNIFKKEKK